MLRSRTIDPVILEMPDTLLAVVTTVGDPNTAAEAALRALYGTVYTLKFALKKQGINFTVSALRARWPDAHLKPKAQWTGCWGLPLPAGTTMLLQKDPTLEVRIETWHYGTVAQVLHLGPYSTEGDTVARLHAFITDNGYEIAGMHEEEYLTRPTAKVPKTLIRYPIAKRVEHQ